jgi:hypothetical protein
VPPSRTIRQDLDYWLRYRLLDRSAAFCPDSFPLVLHVLRFGIEKIYDLVSCNPTQAPRKYWITASTVSSNRILPPQYRTLHPRQHVHRCLALPLAIRDRIGDLAKPHSQAPRDQLHESAIKFRYLWQRVMCHSISSIAPPLQNPIRPCATSPYVFVESLRMSKRSSFAVLTSPEALLACGLGL